MRQNLWLLALTSSLLLCPLARAGDAPASPAATAQPPDEAIDAPIEPAALLEKSGADADAHASKKNLTRAALVAFMARDADALIDLIIDSPTFFQVCPGFSDRDIFKQMYPNADDLTTPEGQAAFEAEFKKTGEELTKMLSKEARAESIQKYFERCAGYDFSRATPLKVTGGEVKKQSSLQLFCPGLTEYKDITVEFELDGRSATLKLDDPISSEGRFYIGETVICRLK